MSERGKHWAGVKIESLMSCWDVSLGYFCRQQELRSEADGLLVQ